MAMKAEITGRTGRALKQLKNLSQTEEIGKDASRTPERAKKLSRKSELPHGVWKTSLLNLLSVWSE